MRWKTAEYSGWGRVLRAQGDVARPEKITALRAIMKDGAAPAIGNGRSYGDAGLNGGGQAINMTRLDRLLAFDATTGILEAEAGITIGEIARVFAPKGFIPPVMPGTGFASLGGCIGNDVHGKNHHGVGSFGQHVLSIDLLGANGRMRMISPETAPELFAATIGGLGQTGIIVSAKIRLVPCASEVMSVRETRVDNLAEFLALFEQSNASYSVGWIDATATGANLGRGILEEAEISDHGDPIPLKRARSIPKDAPSFFLAPPVVRLFNHFYLRRVPLDGRRVDRAMQDFFFPLDRIHNWNRLYGKPGFHQFQCVVPEGAARETVARMMGLIASSGLASPLAVIKRLGEGHGGLMSFPMAGVTLAVDFPNRAKAAALIGELEEMALAAGGRIYLAKDSLASGAMIAAMYSELPEFQRVANNADKDHQFETDLTRRLNLRGAL